MRINKFPKKKLKLTKSGEGVKLLGYVVMHPEHQLFSKLESKRCVIDAYFILQGHGENRTEIYNNTENIPFLLKSQNTYILIDIKDVSVDLKGWKSSLHDFGGRKAKLVTELMNEMKIKRFNYGSPVFIFDFIEACLKPRDWIKIGGKGYWAEASEKGLPDKYGKIWVMDNSLNKKLYLTNKIK